MATENKDFKVKNGLVVTEGGAFGGTVSVATPTSNNHAVTKLYVDNLVSSIENGSGGGGAGLLVDDTEPQDPAEGTLWLDTVSNRIKYYNNNEWKVLSIYEDTLKVSNHTHDESGFVGSNYFIDAGSPNEINVYDYDAGSTLTSDWNETYSGGII